MADNETQAEINARLTSGVASNTAAIVSETMRALNAEGRIKMCVKYMGNKNTPSDLPASGNANGDFWYVKSNHNGYFWNANLATPAWENVGEITTGISPEATVSAAGSVVTITITDVNGTTTATVISPVVNQSDLPSGNGKRITIVDQSHPASNPLTVDLYNGTNGIDGTDGEDGEDGADGTNASASVVKTSVDATGNKRTTITCQTGSSAPTTASIDCPDIKIVESSSSATEAGTIYFVTGS